MQVVVEVVVDICSRRNERLRRPWRTDEHVMIIHDASTFFMSNQIRIRPDQACSTPPAEQLQCRRLNEPIGEACGSMRMSAHTCPSVGLVMSERCAALMRRNKGSTRNKVSLAKVACLCCTSA